MTFSAEFNDPSAPLFLSGGGQFSPTLAHWGNLRSFPDNHEQQTYVDTSFGGADAYNPFRVADGALTITAAPTPAGLKDDVSSPYVSGVLETSGGPASLGRQSGGFWQQYGYWEMRAELPAGKGFFPAFWLVGNGEIDIMEMIGSDPYVVLNSTHDFRDNEHTSAKAAVGADASVGWHTYGLEWTADSLDFYIDGRVVNHLDGAAFRDFGESFLIVNFAVGSDMTGFPDATTPFPAEMKVDYIRAYQQDAAGSPIQAAPATTASASDPMLLSTTPVYLTGTAGADSLVGYAGKDWLEGKGGDDTLSGNGGDDGLSGGDGSDTISGGAGDDTLYGDLGGDTLDGGDGSDILYSGAGDDRMAGGAGADSFRMAGNEGRDTITDFQHGTDRVALSGVSSSGTTWQPTIVEGVASVQVNLSGGGTLLLKGLSSLSSGDLLFDGTARDVAKLGDAAQAVQAPPTAQPSGSTAPASVTGGTGSDTLSGSGGSDWLSGWDGDDVLGGKDGNDTLSGGDGKDSLFGDGGADTLYGDDGADWIFGGAGNDTLWGGAGDDRLQGDAGADLFATWGNEGRDTIQDFVRGTDRIKLMGVEPTDVHWSAAPHDGIAAMEVRFAAGGSILLDNVSALSQSDLLFA
jgi:Ca2+-binding RTX toxin-like protein